MAEKEKLNDIKVILVGEPGTGKTCLINVATGREFLENSDSTIISTYITKTIVKDNCEYFLDLWDTAGQEKYRSMTKIFTKNSNIVIFVYAINNKQTFDEMKSYWVKTIKESLGDEPILGIVGNKNDLYIKEEIKEEEARNFANEIGAQFKLVSAKDDPNGFISFLEELLDEFLAKKGIDLQKNDNININKDTEKQINKKKKCC